MGWNVKINNNECPYLMMHHQCRISNRSCEEMICPKKSDDFMGCGGGAVSYGNARKV